MPEPAPQPSVLDRASPTRPGWIETVDPRTKLLGALAFAMLTAVLGRLPALGPALAIAASAAIASGLGLGGALRRLLPLNVFMLVVLIVVPLSAGGEPIATWGPLEVSRQGLHMAAVIALKGNAIVLAAVALVGTLDMITLGHTLHHLRAPDKLTHVLLFTVRYIEVLERERRRLSAAMKLRGFRPGFNRHTWRSYGNLVGMLLVRSLDRSDRIVAAMKCRGFRGRFYLLDHFAFTRRDAVFAVVELAAVLALAAMEWA